MSVVLAVVLGWGWFTLGLTLYILVSATVRRVRRRHGGSND